MELRHLRLFVYVAETLSFSIAATRCCPFLQLIVPTGFCCCCFGCRDYSQDYTIMKEKKVKVTPEAMTEPSSDDLKEKKKESWSKFRSFFPILDRRRRFPSYHISVVLALIVRPLILLKNK